MIQVPNSLALDCTEYSIAYYFFSPVHADSLIRCSPGDDATNGFFVSAFVRTDDPEFSRLHKRKAEEECIEPIAISDKSSRKKKKKKKRRKVSGSITQDTE
jgi:hypothetical protein